MKNLKQKALIWVLSRRSADDTSNRGMWVVVGLVLVLAVFLIIKTGAIEGFTNGIGIFVDATDGTQVKPPGAWGE